MPKPRQINLRIQLRLQRRRRAQECTRKGQTVFGLCAKIELQEFACQDWRMMGTHWSTLSCFSLLSSLDSILQSFLAITAAIAVRTFLTLFWSQHSVNLAGPSEVRLSVCTAQLSYLQVAASCWASSILGLLASACSAQSSFRWGVSIAFYTII